MSQACARLAFLSPSSSWADEALSVLAGLAFTGGLFLTIAHFERHDDREPREEIPELRAVAMPLEPPPPRVEEKLRTEVPTELPFAGLDVEANSSPVKIAVVPPDLEAFVPHSDVPPAAAIQVATLYTAFKPQMDLEADFSRVFQSTEVDQRPTVLSRPNPFIPSYVRNKAEVLRVLLLITVNVDGAVQNVRILNSSGNPKFDAIIVEGVRAEWMFTPAVKKGHKVRCLLQQSVAVTWRNDGSPFDP